MSYRKNWKAYMIMGAVVVIGGALTGYCLIKMGAENPKTTSENSTLRDVDISVGESGTNIDLTKALTDGKVTIDQGGTYILSGSMTGGQIVVDAENAQVELVLDGVQASNESDSVLRVKAASQVTLTLADGSDNTFACTGEYDENDEDTKNSVISSKVDLIICGSGALSVKSDYGDGIKSKADITMTAGNCDIDVAGDGVTAEGKLEIDDGVLDIVSGGGSENGKTHTDRDMPSDMKGFPGKGEFPDMGNFPQGGEKPDMGDFPQNGEKPDMGDFPQNGEKPDMDNFPRNGEKPDMDNFQQDKSLSETSQEESTKSTKGLKAETAVLIKGGTIKVDSADDSVHSNGTLQISAGNLELASGDDGVHAGENLTVDGGTINVTKCYEGLEGLNIVINGGDISVVSDDDGFNAAGDSAGECKITINGGTIYVKAGGDGLDSNGDIEINDGETYVDGPSDNGNTAIDFGDRAKAVINGGTLVAVGSSGMAESFDSSSTQGFMLVKLDKSWDAGSSVSLTDSSGTEIISHTAAKTFNCVEVSCESIKKGESYTLRVEDYERKIEMTDLIYSDKKGRY